MTGLSSSTHLASAVALPRSSVSFQKASVSIRERYDISIIVGKVVNLSSGMFLCVCGGVAALLSVSKHLEAKEKHHHKLKTYAFMRIT